MKSVVYSILLRLYFLFVIANRYILSGRNINAGFSLESMTIV